MNAKNLFLVTVIIVLTVIGCSDKMKTPENDTISWLYMLPKDNPSMHDQKELDAKWNIEWDLSIVDDKERSEKWYSDWVQLGKKEIPDITSILERFLSEKDSRVYDLGEIAFALGLIGDPKSVPVLIEALQSKNLNVRIEAANALGRIGDKRAIKSLCSAAISDESHNVRANAAAALGKLGGVEAKDCLLQAVNDKNDFVASIAKEALKEMK